MSVTATEPAAISAFNLAVNLQNSGKFDEAIEQYNIFISAYPAVSVAHSHLAICFCALRRFDEAIGHYEHALFINKGSPLEEAISTNPMYRHSFVGLINSLNEIGDIARAEIICWEYFRRFPEENSAHELLCRVLLHRHQYDAALYVYKQSPAESRIRPEMLTIFGSALSALGPEYTDEAVSALRKALAIKPMIADARSSLVNALLRSGRYIEGWSEMRPLLKPLAHPDKEWKGESLSGKMLLIHKELGVYGGFGDTIQLSRYIDIIINLGAIVILLVQHQQLNLFWDFPKESITLSDGTGEYNFDYHIGLMGLPRVLGTTISTIPNKFPYFRCNPEKQKKWDEILSPLKGLRIGISWSGRKYYSHLGNKINDGRHIEFYKLADILETSGVSFVSLQFDEAGKEAERYCGGHKIYDVSDYVGDYSDTVAIISCIDLVISVDSSVAHLAGACGKPVWVMLQYNCCWRWMYDRDDSPWYPTACLFRQKAPGAWDEVISRIASRIKEVSQASGRRELPLLPV